MKGNLLALSLAASSLAFAVDREDHNMRASAASNECCANDCCSDDCCCGCCCQPHPNQCLDSWGYAPPYYDLNCAWGFSAGIDFLYWYGRERDLPVAYRLLDLPLTPDNQTTSTVFDKALYPNAQWDPGVRLFVSWDSCCDGWDLLLQWTWYKNSKCQSFSTPSSGTDADTFLQNPWEDNLLRWDTIKSDWEFQYNQLDLQLGRRYWLSPCFTLRPFTGLRFLWSDVDFGSKSYLDEVLSPDVTQSNFSNVSHDNKNWGAGLVGGVEPRFYFTPCFSLYGGFGVSLLWGKIETNRKQEIYVSTVRPTSTLVSQDQTYRACSEHFGMQSLFDTELGLRYEMTFCDRSYLGYLEAGWEHHLLLNHVVRYQLVSEDPTFVVHRNDVGFGGFVLNFGVMF